MARCAALTRPRRSHPDHVAVEPIAGNHFASWWCVDEAQHCTSHNPCDCCEAEQWQL